MMSICGEAAVTAGDSARGVPGPALDQRLLRVERGHVPVLPDRSDLHPGDIRQCLETLLVVMMGEDGGFRDAVEHPVTPRM